MSHDNWFLLHDWIMDLLAFCDKSLRKEINVPWEYIGEKPRELDEDDVKDITTVLEYIESRIDWSDRYKMLRCFWDRCLY